MKSRPYGDRHFQVGLHSDRPDTRIHLARPQAQEMTFHISQSQCWEASKSQLVTMTSEICLPRSLTSVSSSTAQKVRSRQHFPRRIKEEIKEQLRTLIFVIYWFSHYCNFIETNISSFIIMSYHKQALRNSCELLRLRKELHTFSWNCMQVHGTSCKLI